MPEREWKRENVWLRQLLMSPTGGGKTLGALAVAVNLFPGANLPVVLLDTEYERGKLYADLVNLASYRVLEDDFSPESYIAEIDAIEEKFRGGVLVIDSVTHEWSGSKGVLEIVDSGGGGNWKAGTPRHNKFVDRLMRLQMHLIVCCRSKMKYEYSTDDRGKRKQEKLGIGPEQRDNFLYNFDVVADIDASTHQATFTNRCRPLVDKSFSLVPDLDNLYAENQVADILTAWLSEGDPPDAPAAADPALVEALVPKLLECGISMEVIEERFAKARNQNRGELAPEYIQKTTEWADNQIAKKAQALEAELLEAERRSADEAERSADPAVA